MEKVMEKVAVEQLVAHLESKVLLHPLQFGFKKNHSTDTACCFLLEDIKSQLRPRRSGWCSLPRPAQAL